MGRQLEWQGAFVTGFHILKLFVTGVGCRSPHCYRVAEKKPEDQMSGSLVNATLDSPLCYTASHAEKESSQSLNHSWFSADELRTETRDESKESDCRHQ